MLTVSSCWVFSFPKTDLIAEVAEAMFFFSCITQNEEENHSDLQPLEYKYKITKIGLILYPQCN